LKVGEDYNEMEVKEKDVDMFVEIIRKEKIDENVKNEDIEK
jgi:glycerol-3-phosphate dehydrogenase